MAIIEVTFSRHALERMAERSISKGQVRRTVLEPDSATGTGERRVAERRTEVGNTIRVVYALRT